MAKIIAFAALFIALIARATAYTTVVTTTVINDENPQSCQSEVQKMNMEHCRQWMQQGISPYEGTSFLRSVVANTEDHQQQCCSEMRKVRQDCHCEMMRKMMKDMQQMQPTMEKMQAMFNKCGVQMPMGCSYM